MRGILNEKHFPDTLFSYSGSTLTGQDFLVLQLH